MKARPKFKLPDDEDSARKLVLENLPTLKFSGKAKRLAFIVALLERFPTLAAENYKCESSNSNTFMLYIFLEYRASLSNVKRVYELYPRAVTEVEDDGGDQHPIVRQFERLKYNDSSLVNALAFLVQKSPQLSQKRDQSGLYPIQNVIKVIQCRQCPMPNMYRFVNLARLLLESYPACCNGHLLKDAITLPDEAFDLILQKAETEILNLSA